MIRSTPGARIVLYVCLFLLVSCLGGLSEAMTQSKPDLSKKDGLFTEEDSCTLGVSVSIFEDTTFVPVGSPFTVYLWIDEPLCFFDGYETVITWDPAYILLDSVPARQESLMTEVCENEPWWLTLFFTDSLETDSVFISHVVLCGGDSLAGPGALSSLNFVAQQAGETSIDFEYIEFYLHGDHLEPVVSQDGIVKIGVSDAGDAEIHTATDMGLQVCPNPGNYVSRVRFQVPEDGSVGLDLYDASGRRIAAILDRQRLTPGWHILDRSSASVLSDLPQGVYFLRLKTEMGTAARKITVVK